jgi:hypothetical protein
VGPLSKQLDTNLARLVWSLWTELGVAGLQRNHQTFSIVPEELIILTAALSEFDPRLRDEALDWCIRYHRFISPIRLQILAEKYKDYISDSFSVFSTTFNTLSDSRTKWVVLTKVPSLKFRARGKSTLRNLAAPSMIFFRLRSFLGVGARSDILAFLISEKDRDFTASDLLETGYSKRRLAQILDGLAEAEILSRAQVRNQFHYALIKRNPLIQLLGNIPKKMVHWDQILAVLLPIRACLHNVENTSVGVRAIDMRNLLKKLSKELQQIHLTPPPLQNDLEAYWESIVKWIHEFSLFLAKGDF